MALTSSGQRHVQVGHHLPDLRSHIIAPDELAVGVDGVLPADIDGRGTRRHHRDMAESGRLDQ